MSLFHIFPYHYFFQPTGRPKRAAWQQENNVKSFGLILIVVGPKEKENQRKIIGKYAVTSTKYDVNFKRKCDN